jgi:hypothetical protein
VIAVGGAPRSALAATPPIGTFPVWSSSAAGEFDAVFAAASGFPAAHVSTDNTGASVAAGKSAFLGATTGFGQQFGSSRLQPYLTIGANGLLSPSTTTITFASPAPVGWSFALGDIDADYVSIVATSGGTPLTSTELGVRDSAPGSAYLNYCRAASPKPTGCAAIDAPYDDFPTWCPTGAAGPCAGKPENTLLGDGSDSSGSYQWFVPTVPVDAVTLTFTAQIGFPSYQLWLVAPSPATTVTGDVQLATPDEPIPAGVLLELLDAAGTPVTDIQDEPVLIPVAPDGGFSFVTGDGDYQLDIVVPEGIDPAPEQFPFAFTAAGDALNLGVLALAPTAAPAALPPTGSDPLAPVALAAALLALGVALLGGVARRARRIPPRATPS